ncbi:MAG TPA: DoxX family protein [Candidatus Limnocylindria bacterium]|nr:DoxX family protein [Candidatus Limnocylindria bacterium]
MRSRLYWGVTIWLTFELAVGGAVDLVRGRAAVIAGDPVDVVVSSLGYPVYVLFFLGLWKILGAAAIIAPGFPRLKEWAYAGSFFQITLAAMSHAIVGTDPVNLVYPIVVTLLTLASWALRPPDRALAVG